MKAAPKNSEFKMFWILLSEFGRCNQLVPISTPRPRYMTILKL
jgi:hypothetical protein